MKFGILALLMCVNSALFSEVLAVPDLPPARPIVVQPTMTPEDDITYKHNLAVSQVKMLKEVVAYETYIYLIKQGSRSDTKRLRDITEIANKCSFIFTALGKDSTERFVRFMEWGMEESGFRNIICHWKKGQYLRGLDLTLTYDSTDYGVWQINDVNDWSLVPRLRWLYESGVINFKILHVRKMQDFMDMPTNLAMRCVVEDERKAIGMNWKHENAPDYRKYILARIKELESEKLYNRALVDKYYYVAPIKTYGNKQVSQ